MSMSRKEILVCSALVVVGTALLAMHLMGQNVDAVAVKKTIIDKQIELTGIDGEYFPFTVPPGVSDVHLSGKIKVVGGHLQEVSIGLYYAKDCPVTGSSTSQFLKCKAYSWANYNNDNNSFGYYIQSRQKYYLVFQSFAVLGEAKIITPTVTLSYNQ